MENHPYFTYLYMQFPFLPLFETPAVPQVPQCRNMNSVVPLGLSTALQCAVRFCWDYFKWSSRWARIFHKYIWSIKIWSEAKWSDFICPGQAHSILKLPGALLIHGRHHLTHLYFKSQSRGLQSHFGWAVVTGHAWTGTSVLYKKTCELEILETPKITLAVWAGCS